MLLHPCLDIFSAAHFSSFFSRQLPFSSKVYILYVFLPGAFPTLPLTFKGMGPDENIRFTVIILYHENKLYRNLLSTMFQFIFLYGYWSHGD